MSVIRFLFAGGFAAVVTAALVLLMHILIQTNIKPPQEGKKYKIPDIVMPEREIVTEYDTSKPDRPDEVEEPPPEMPDIEFDTPELTDDGINITGPKIDKPKVAGPGAIGSDGDMIPLSRVNAEYPQRAANRGIEGSCTVMVTVTEIGTTENIQEAECTNNVFKRASEKAAAKWKFKPRIVDGKAVKVPEVVIPFTFSMQGGE